MNNALPACEDDDIAEVKEMANRQWVTEKALLAQEKKAAYGSDIDFAVFADEDTNPPLIPDPAQLPAGQRKNLEAIGFETEPGERAGAYMQTDHAVVHCQVAASGVEVMTIGQALACHPELEEEYFWQAVAPDVDKYTARAVLHGEHGYFIRALPGVKVEHPVQACLYIGTEGVIQDVHNLVIVEEEAELHVITGCGTDPDVKQGMHIGISEFYVKKGCKLTFTMIHRWGEDVAVRPRTGVIVEAGGLYMSNYVCMHGVKDIQMYPTVKLVGEGAVARLNSILVAPPGSHQDVGGRVILSAPGTKAEVIARTISTGGVIVNRGALIGESGQTKAHLECNGLLLAPDGRIHAIPELDVRSDDAEFSHEAAVGKIAPEEIEYLMARGLGEEEATATIVRGFLNVKIEGLPDSLAKQIERAVEEFSGSKGI